MLLGWCASSVTADHVVLEVRVLTRTKVLNLRMCACAVLMPILLMALRKSHPARMHICMHMSEGPKLHPASERTGVQRPTHCMAMYLIWNLQSQAEGCHAHLQEHVTGEANEAGVPGFRKACQADLLAGACLVHLEQDVWAPVRQHVRVFCDNLEGNEMLSSKPILDIITDHSTSCSIA